MATMAGASGTRSWLQARHRTWLTPRRMRAATATLFVAAFGISSVGLTGSTPGAPASVPAMQKARVRSVDHAPLTAAGRSVTARSR
jgi:hypothetical protein